MVKRKLKPIRYVANTGQKIALTFDDGPHPQYTKQILERLKNYKAKATFFIVGAKAVNHPSLVRAILEEGHEVGNHSYTHRRLTKLSEATVRQEISMTDLILHSLGAEKHPPFRAPYGEDSSLLSKVLAETGRRNILFNCESMPPDFKSPSSLAISCSIAKKAKPGSIIVLHDGIESETEERKTTVEATEQLLEFFQRNEYYVGTVGDFAR